MIRRRTLDEKVDHLIEEFALLRVQVDKLLADRITQVHAEKPQVIVVDSEATPPHEDGNQWLSDLALETGALVIALPGGSITTMTLEEAKGALKEVITAWELR